MKKYIPTIGLEIHIQLKTKSKMFCSCSADYFGQKPNTHTCPTCLGLPGALPTLNQKAVDAAIKLGLALNCEINRFSKFDRKNYFYPDLAKGYQISQFDLPVAKNGYIFVQDRKIRINRAHLEEDTGKLIHTKKDSEDMSLIDFNRSGVPLMEIVSEPDIESPQEAKNYAKKIHQIARYLEVSDVDMEKAGMRFDANVSVRPEGQSSFGTKVEIKNINSFRFLEKALSYEIARQIRELEKGKKINQETRGWVEEMGVTRSQRGKETSPDYRYFPDPDLVPLVISPNKIEEIKREIPELPDQKIERYVKEYNLSKDVARNLCEDKNIAQWFENTLKYKKEGKITAQIIANWINTEVLRILKEKNIDIIDCLVEPASFYELLALVDQGIINQLIAKQILAKMFETGLMPLKIIEMEGLEQMSGSSELTLLVEEVLRENISAVKDYKSGKESSLDFLIGQVMKKTKGRANPKIVGELLRDKLKDGNFD